MDQPPGSRSNLPTEADDVQGWRDYLQTLQSKTGQVVVAGAEFYLSGLSIANEGADWIVTINEIQNAKSPGEVAFAAVAFLPIVSAGSIRIYRGAGDAVQISAREASQIKTIQKMTSESNVYKTFVRHNFSLVVQRSDIQFAYQNVDKLIKGSEHRQVDQRKCSSDPQARRHGMGNCASSSRWQKACRRQYY